MQPRWSRCSSTAREWQQPCPSLVLIHLSAAGSCNHGACSQRPRIKDDKSVQGAARPILAWHLKWRGKKEYRSRLPPRTQFQPQCWSLLSAAGAGKRSEPCHSSAAATVVASRTPHFAIIGRPGSGTPPHYAPVVIAGSASGMASFRGSRRKTGSRTSAVSSSGRARSSTGWASRSRSLRSTEQGTIRRQAVGYAAQVGCEQPIAG